jgi:hypothetical protein
MPINEVHTSMKIQKLDIGVLMTRFNRQSLFSDYNYNRQLLDGFFDVFFTEIVQFA